MTSTVRFLAVAVIASQVGCAPGGSSHISTNNSRLQNTIQPISLDQSEVLSELSSQSFLVENVLALTPTLTLVGTLASPTVNSTVVQASDITVNGNKIYVAYNTAGTTIAGAVDVIDMTVPTTAHLVSQKTFADMDINKVYVNAGMLYAAGATYDNGAVLTRVALDGAGALTNMSQSAVLRSQADASLPAHAATSVVAAGSYVYALSGSNGGISILNASDLSEHSFTPVDSARDIAVSAAGNSLYVVTGRTASTQASIFNFSLAGAAINANTRVLANAQIDDAKSTLSTGSLMQVATAGAGGARLLCLNGTELGHATNPTLPALAAADQTANAAAFGEGYLFIANGGAGVTVYSVNVPLIPLGCNLVTITKLGRFSFGETSSINNLYFANGHLVVATGTEGFKIVKVTTSLLSGLLQAL